MNNKTLPYAILSVIFAIAVCCFFGIVYPHHIHFQEQYQLFLFDAGYVRQILALPGGVADLLGRFCTQFFLFAWGGAAILALLLLVVQRLTARLFDCGQYYGLTFVPACLLWLFMLDENALVGSLWAVVITLLAMWGWRRLQRRWLQLSALVLAVPVLYWAVGPVCHLFFFYCLVTSRRNAPWPAGCILVLMFLPSLLQHYVGVPKDSLLSGVHYYRSPDTTPLLLSLALFSYMLLYFIGWAKAKWCAKPVKPLLSYLTLAVVWGAQVWILLANCNLKAEQVMGYDYMARHQQWNRIISTARAVAPNNAVTVTSLNLALAMKGQLADHMFEYNQNGLAGLLPPFERDAVSPLTTAEAFYQLGMINSAQRFTFEAQEAILDYQKSARCYKRLAETNLINGDYAVARKYIEALGKTLFYSDWANEAFLLLDNDEAVSEHPEYGRLRQNRIKENNFFDERDTPQMLGELLMSNRQNRLAFEYLEAAYLLTGNVQAFVDCFELGQNLGYTAIPKHFQEALMLWWSHNHAANEPMPVQLSQNVVQGMNRFYSLSSTPGMTNAGLTKQFGDTYWYYFFTRLQQ